MEKQIPHAQSPIVNRQSAIATLVVWGLGLVGAGAVFFKLDGHVLNVVTYKLHVLTDPPVALTYVVPVFVLAGLAWLAYWRRTPSGPSPESAGAPPLPGVGDRRLFAPGFRLSHRLADRVRYRGYSSSSP